MANLHVPAFESYSYRAPAPLAIHRAVVKMSYQDFSNVAQVDTRKVFEPASGVTVRIHDVFVYADTVFGDGAGPISTVQLHVGTDDVQNAFLYQVPLGLGFFAGVGHAQFPAFRGPAFRDNSSVSNVIGQDVGPQYLTASLDVGAGNTCDTLTTGTAYLVVYYSELLLSTDNLQPQTLAAVATPALATLRLPEAFAVVNFGMSPYAIATTDEYLLMDTSGGATNIQLPAANATGQINRRLRIKHDVGAAGGTVTPNGGDTIDGVAGPYALPLNAVLTIRSTGTTNWLTE